MLGALLLAVGCSSGGGAKSTATVAAPRSASPVATSTESPGDSAVRLEGVLSAQGYDAYYEQIHPAIRQFVPKGVFLDCANKGEAGITQHIADSIEVGLVRNLRDAVFSQDNFVPPSDQPKVVMLSLKQADSTLSLNRFVAIADGQWRWFMTGSAIRAYQARKCPGAAP